MASLKHITTWLLLLSVITLGSAISAKTALGGYQASFGASMGESTHNPLNRLGNNLDSSCTALGFCNGADRNPPNNKNSIDTDSEAAGFSQYDQYRNSDGSWDWPQNDGFVGGTIKQKTLPVGTSLDRYGGTRGGYLAPQGTPIDQRALAPGSLADGYKQYEVIKPLPIKSGQTAPAFGQSGGGAQYKIINPKTGKPASVQWLLDNKYIRNVDG